ncbi:MAG: hypothetical protein ABEK50_05100, partial [bacterium]
MIKKAAGRTVIPKFTVYTSVLIVCVLLCSPVQSKASALLNGWQWEQNGRLEFMNINTRDSAVLTPYPNDGAHSFLDVGFQAKRNVSRYTREDFQLYGVWNGSAYRQNDRGFIVERVSYLRESGKAKIPYRLTVGDFFGKFSRRTLQRSLQGLSLELQPNPWWNYNQSIQVLNGAILPNQWRNLDDYTGSSHGLSWLLQKEKQSINLNFVYNRLRDDTSAGLSERHQSLMGLALFRRLYTADQSRLNLELEADFFSGDHRSFGGVQGKNGQAYFTQVTGRNGKRLNYLLRFEDYSRHYRPAGVAITP